MSQVLHSVTPAVAPPKPFATPRETVAVVGTGISGMLAAYLLHDAYDVTVFEASDRIGGHTSTERFELDGRRYAVDTGFIVFNDWTYPNFIRLLERLGVASQASDMGFSVRCERSGLEYNGRNLDTLFAQRSNLLRPGFHRMLLEILRFNREARGLLDGGDPRLTLGEFVDAGGYSRRFVEHYLIPMAAAIWSSDAEGIRAFPAAFFARFFANHGMLSVDDRPEWRVIKGGSDQYVGKLTAPYRDRIRLATPVARIERLPDHVRVTPRSGAPERFDHVVVACHSDQALRMLADPSDDERSVLGALPYRPNPTQLHTDASLLPRREKARAAWNYHVTPGASRGATVTYHMNRLQSIQAPHEFCVSLNREDAVDPARVIKRHVYHHPVFTPDGIAAQGRHAELNGERRTYFCGAYWGYGFHEDGVNSALTVCREFARAL